MREAREYSRAELAQRCGGSPSESTIKQIEYGERPRADIVMALSRALEVSVWAFFARTTDAPWERVALAFDLSLKDARRLHRELERRHGVAEIATHDEVIQAWLALKRVPRGDTRSR